jgi:hypothetical protein
MMSGMQELQEQAVDCPYCGERIQVLLEPGEAGQQYTEDCQVCCRPILFDLVFADGELLATVRREDD